jgi:hypothetical protein
MKRNFFLFDTPTDGGQGGGQNPPPAPAPAGDPPAGGQQPGPIPYERFKQVNDELSQLKNQMTQLQTAEQKRKEDEAKEQGKWKEIAEKNEADLKAERLNRTRLEVAAKKGIPVDLVGRLQGTTPEEIEKDADALLAFLKPAPGPGVPPAGKGGSQKPLDITKMSPKEIREKRNEIWEQQVRS